MSAQQRLQVQRRPGPELCLLCRDRVVAGRGADCLGCGARYHKACIDTDRRCRNFGCSGEIRELAGRGLGAAEAQAPPTPAGALSALHSGYVVLNGIVAALSLVGMVVWLIDVHRWPPQAIIAASLVIGAALVITLARSEPI